MKHSLKIGFSFGLTSGIITTLGLMIGLNSGTNSKIAVLGGILTIAIADSFSDAMGIHVSEESEEVHTDREIWESTLCTFFVKFIVASSFIIPVIFLNLTNAMIFSLIYGFSLLGIFSYKMAIKQNKKISYVVLEHILVGMLVVFLAHFSGVLISNIFQIY